MIISFLITLYLMCEEFNPSLQKQDELNIPLPVLKTEKITQKNIMDFYKNLDLLFGNEDKARQHIAYKSIESKSITLYTLNMNQIHDKYLYTDIKFETSKKTIVYLSLTKASNCPGGLTDCKESDKFLLAFTFLSQTVFIKVKDVINVGFIMSGSKKITIDGEEYTVKIYANISDVYSSRIEVKSTSKTVINKKLSEIMDVFKEFGYNVNLNGKKYIIVYGRKLECISSCSFTSSNMVFIFEYPVTKDSSYYSIDEKIYSGRSIYFPTLGKNILFNLSDGILKIYKSEN